MILADDYQLKMPGLPIIHALHHVKHHKNASAVIVMTNGAILDLATTDLKKIKLDEKQKTRNGEAYLPIALNQLKDQVKPLGENRFDLALVIGGEPREVNITEELAVELFKFNKARMNEKGVIRIQICNFADKTIGTSSKVFANEVTPDFCLCSIPKGYSIIAPQGTRAIDLPKEESNFMDTTIFDEHKVSLKHMLSDKKNISNEQIINKIPNIHVEIVDLNELYKKNASFSPGF